VVAGGYEPKLLTDTVSTFSYVPPAGLSVGTGNAMVSADDVTPDWVQVFVPDESQAMALIVVAAVIAGAIGPLRESRMPVPGVQVQFGVEPFVVAQMYSVARVVVVVVTATVEP
jgi:hypothetical protein